MSAEPSEHPHTQDSAPRPPQPAQLFIFLHEQTATGPFLEEWMVSGSTSAPKVLNSSPAAPSSAGEKTDIYLCIQFRFYFPVQRFVLPEELLLGWAPNIFWECFSPSRAGSAPLCWGHLQSVDGAGEGLAEPRTSRNSALSQQGRAWLGQGAHPAAVAGHGWCLG